MKRKTFPNSWAGRSERTMAGRDVNWAEYWSYLAVAINDDLCVAAVSCRAGIVVHEASLLNFIWQPSLEMSASTCMQAIHHCRHRPLSIISHMHLRNEYRSCRNCFEDGWLRGQLQLKTSAKRKMLSCVFKRNVSIVLLNKYQLSHCSPERWPLCPTNAEKSLWPLSIETHSR